MEGKAVRDRIDNLLWLGNQKDHNRIELKIGTLNLLQLLYGINSTQVQIFLKELENSDISIICHEFLISTRNELKAGFIPNLRNIVTGDILTDFLKLSRANLNGSGENAKNVAAVLAAALFEDTIRRIATTNGIPHIEKLADVLSELKNQRIMHGTQVGIAQGYLNFRNNALHAQWEKIERESVASVLSFTEQLLVKHFF